MLRRIAALLGRSGFLALALVVGACTATATLPPEPTATLAETPTEAPEPTQPPVATATEPKDPVSLGRSLAARNGCAACHSVDGSSLIGPTWQGLFGNEETLADGSTVLVDEAYLIESIVEPNAKIVRGFPPDIMPQDFAQKLSDEQIDAIITYIKTL
ncbi:MAG: c-type cytochrome [Anaerolineae bacterium]